MQPAIDHAHQHDDTHIGVEPRIDDHGAQWRVGLATRRRHLGDDLLQHVVDAHARLGRDGDGIGCIDADHVLDLGLGVVRIGLRQIHLVEHWQHLDAQIERGVAVGHRLRFNTLRGIDDEQRTFACRQRARHFIREVDVARRVDQIEVVDVSIACGVLQRGGLRLDGYPPLLLDVHRVEHLLAHLAISEAAATRDESIGQRGLAMIDVRND